MRFHREVAGIFVGAVVLGLSGCAQLSEGLPTSSDNGLPPCEPAGGSEGEVGVRYDAIREMMDDDRPRAALSHIEALENELGRTQRSQLWRAQALRQIGHLEVSGVIYRRLTQGCLAGEAYHGLGKVAGEKGEWIEAEQLLKRAVRHDPISSRKHNDLGYAHLKTGASGLAIEEFRTALELDPGRSRSANNLILALLIAGESAEAQRISRRLDLDQGRWRALQRQAAEWEASRVSANPVPPADSADIDNRSGDQGEHVSRPTGEMTPTVGAISGDGADMTGEKAEPSELDGQPAPEKQAERFEGGDESSDAEAGAANAGKASSDTDDAAVESGDEPSDEESEMPEKEDQS